MARASIYTLLSLDRFAKIFGISPLHFNQASTPDIDPEVFKITNCSGVWFQYDWQKFDQVSREQIAEKIKGAEDEIAKVIKYHPAPVWIAKEQHAYPRPYRREYYGVGTNIRHQMKSVSTNFGKIIATGRRSVGSAPIAQPSVGGLPATNGEIVYTDADGDSFFETCTITLNNVTVTDVCELKYYFTGHGGNPEWEIRVPRSKTLVAGVLTAVFDSWLFINPTLWEAYPTGGGLNAINVSTANNFVDEIDIYREFTDLTQASSQFNWEPHATPCAICSGVGCDACTNVTQTGCANLRDQDTGIVVPIPASYDTGTALWAKENWTGCREPDFVGLWYQAGDVSQRYLQGFTCDPLSDYWATTIAWLAMARIERELCACGNLQAISKDLREMVNVSLRDKTIFTPAELLTNPFGTRMGEMMAWRRISKQVTRRLSVAVI